MDKAVEELQLELNLLKNEIKETLTDVREHLLNTVENPFPQDQGMGAITPRAPTPQPAPAAPAPQPTVVIQAPQPAPVAPAPQPAPVAPAPQPTVVGPASQPPTAALDDAPADGPSGVADDADAAARPEPRPGPEPPSAEPERGTVPRPVQGEPVSRAPVRKEESLAARAGASPDPSRARERRSDPATGQRHGTPSHEEGDEPVSRAEGQVDDAAAAQEEDRGGRERDPSGTWPRGPSGTGPRGPSGTWPRDPSGTWPNGTVDLVTVAFLLPWLEEGVRQIGCKSVKSILGVYAAMGGITSDLRDVLTELVGLDNTEHTLRAVSVGDSVRFLVELDDLLWRGRQDWRRAALRSVVANGRALLDAGVE